MRGRIALFDAVVCPKTRWREIVTSGRGLRTGTICGESYPAASAQLRPPGKCRHSPSAFNSIWFPSGLNVHRECRRPQAMTA